MGKSKSLSKFEQGYICAVSNLIGGHGCNTEAWNTFKALGIPLDDIFSWKNLSEYDRENLKELRSFGA